jgi:hypothetical protein
LEISLTDINARNRAGQRGRSRLVSRVNRSNDSRYGRSVGRRFPDSGRYDALTGFVLVSMIVEYTAEQVEEVHGSGLPYWTGLLWA